VQLRSWRAAAHSRRLVAHKSTPTWLMHSHRMVRMRCTLGRRGRRVDRAHARTCAGSGRPGPQPPARALLARRSHRGRGAHASWRPPLTDSPRYDVYACLCVALLFDLARRDASLPLAAAAPCCRCRPLLASRGAQVDSDLVDALPPHGTHAMHTRA
jgi:hypothetical protein